MYSYSVKIKDLENLSSYLETQVIPPKTTDGYVGRIPNPNDVLRCLGFDMNEMVESAISQAYFPNFPNSKPLEIHSDYEERLFRLRRSLIIPIKNCDNLIWHWYKCTDESKIFTYGIPGHFCTVPFLPVEAAEVIETRMGDKPFIADVYTWHCAYNHGPKPAQLLNIRIMPWAQYSLQTEPILPPIDSNIISLY
jgi:hypothetical protein